MKEIPNIKSAFFSCGATGPRFIISSSLGILQIASPDFKATFYFVLVINFAENESERKICRIQFCKT